MHDIPHLVCYFIHPCEITYKKVQQHWILVYVYLSMYYSVEPSLITEYYSLFFLGYNNFAVYLYISFATGWL